MSKKNHISIQIDHRSIDEFAKNIGALSKDIYPKAVSYGINKAGDRIKSLSVKHIASVKNSKQKTIRSRITTKRSTPKTMTLVHNMRVSALNVVSLMTGSQISKWTTKGAKKPKVLKVLGRTFDGGFLNVGKASGKPFAAQRKGKERYPVRILTIPIEPTASNTLGRYTKIITARELNTLIKKDIEARSKNKIKVTKPQTKRI